MDRIVSFTIGCAAMGGVVSYIAFVAGEMTLVDRQRRHMHFLIDDPNRVEYFLNGAAIGGYIGFVTSVFVFPAIRRYGW